MLRLATACLLFVLIPASGNFVIHSAAEPLWAAVSVEQPVYREADNRNIVLRFAIVNDSDSPVYLNLLTSRLSINELELPGSYFLPDDAKEVVLKPGEDYSFSVGLAHNQAKDPGRYRFIWQGDNFKSDPVEARILPKSDAASTDGVN